MSNLVKVELARRGCSECGGIDFETTWIECELCGCNDQDSLVVCTNCQHEFNNYSSIPTIVYNALVSKKDRAMLNKFSDLKARTFQYERLEKYYNASL